MEKKYELDKNDTKEIEGHTLYRIIALKDINNTLNIEKGEKGGYIESESNLSHKGKCWIGVNACVFGNSKVKNDALVLLGNAIIKDVLITGNSRVYGNASITCSRIIQSIVSGDIIISDSYFENSEAFDNVNIITSDISNSVLCDNVTLKNTHVEQCDFQGSIAVNNVCLYGIELKGDAVINSKRDFIVFQNNFSSGRKFVWTRSNDKWCVGCFFGTGKELIEKAYKDDYMKGRYYKAYVNFVETIKEIDDERARKFEQSTKDLSLG